MPASYLYLIESFVCLRRPTIDTKAPEQYGHLKTRMKKLQLQADREVLKFRLFLLSFAIY
jgi:hypothetical protein